MVASDRYKQANFIEVFTMEFIFRLVHNEGSVMPKAELKSLKQAILFKDCNSKEFEHRKRLYHILEKTLVYLGVIEKHVIVLGG